MFQKKIFVAFINAFKGIHKALKKEFAFQVEFCLSLFFIPASFFIGENIVEIILLSGSTLLILMMELVNTSIETTLNRVGLEENILTRYAKDLGSGVVLISLLIWLITWSLIVIY